MPAALPPNSIFLCYRRSDSEVMVDRIYEELTEEFGKNAVFRDIDTIPAGVDFPTYVQQSLRACAAALVCIGRDWGTCPDSGGRPRLRDPDDHVRLEIESALSLPHVRVIPLLVLHGTIPAAEDLPESLRPLRRRNGITVRSSGADYQHDVAHLIRELRRSVSEVAAARRAEAEKEGEEKEAEARKAGKDTVPEPAKSKDLEAILTGLAKLVGLVVVLGLVSQVTKLLPESWTKSPGLRVQTPTPRFLMRSPGPFLIATPTPGPSLPLKLWLSQTPRSGTPYFGIPSPTPFRFVPVTPAPKFP